jgi:hypothetical protein
MSWGWFEVCFESGVVVGGSGLGVGFDGVRVTLGWG